MGGQETLRLPWRLEPAHGLLSLPRRSVRALDPVRRSTRKNPLAKSYGYRKVAELLRIEGWRVNHKKVERLWSEEGLQQPQRHKKRKRLYHHDSSIIRLRPTHPNHVWSIDFVHDRMSNGRPYKMLTVL